MFHRGMTCIETEQRSRSCITSSHNDRKSTNNTMIQPSDSEVVSILFILQPATLTLYHASWSVHMPSEMRYRSRKSEITATFMQISSKVSVLKAHTALEERSIPRAPQPRRYSWEEPGSHIRPPPPQGSRPQAGLSPVDPDCCMSFSCLHRG
jgi:hypothetical protein